MLQMFEDLAPGVNYRVLISIAPPHPSRSASELRQVLAENKIPTFKAQVRRSASVVKAIDVGLTTAEMNGRARLPWQDYQDVGKEVLEAIDYGQA